MQARKTKGYPVKLNYGMVQLTVRRWRWRPLGEELLSLGVWQHFIAIDKIGKADLTKI